MEIIVESKYQDIPALIRYATIVQTVKKEKELNQYADKLISISNKLQLYAYPQNLLNVSNSSILMKILKPLFKEQNMEKNVINLNQADTHFIDSIGVSDVDKNTQRILDAYNNLFKKGNFDKLNRACYRFLKRLKGVNEYDMNEAIINYVVSTICLRDFSQCYNIIEGLAQEYGAFDLNIYLFFLYFCEGRYGEALKKLLKIQNNIYDDFFKYVSEEDLAFYFAFCLLYSFNITDYKEVLSNNNIYVYKLYDKYRNYFEIVDAYYKCDYLKVNNEFNSKLCKKISKDPLLAGNINDIELKFKEKILKEILSFSSEISYKTISDLLVVNKNQVSEMVFNFVKNDNNNEYIIDDIDEIIIKKDTNPMNELLEKSNKILENNLDELIKFSQKNIKHKISVIEGRNLTRRHINPGGDMDHMDPREIAMMMGETG
jgi:hypothetical protein